jgi:hypothetical protein
METYKIIRGGDGWTIAHNSKREGSYETKEAAFEAAFGAASNAIKDGEGITITVEPRAPGETAIGGKP